MKVIVPKELWDVSDVAEGALINWLAEEGGAVRSGSPLAEVMVEKVTYEIQAPLSGTLHILAPVDTPVKPGDVIGEIT